MLSSTMSGMFCTHIANVGAGGLSTSNHRDSKRRKCESIQAITVNVRSPTRNHRESSWLLFLIMTPSMRLLRQQCNLFVDLSASPGVRVLPNPGVERQHPRGSEYLTPGLARATKGAPDEEDPP